jgi:hypothetical protein
MYYTASNEKCKKPSSILHEETEESELRPVE